MAKKYYLGEKLGDSSDMKFFTMKHIFFILSVFLFTAGCANNSSDSATLKKAGEAFAEECGKIFNDTTLTEEQQAAFYEALLRESYALHRDDSLGLSVFIQLITNFCRPEEAIAMYEAASDLIRGDSMAEVKIQSIRNLENVKIGDKYIELSGPDALSGENLSIGSVLAEGKPVLLDFWASWCGPCRKEIQNSLLNTSLTGQVNILGIAVWESSNDDTVEAMKELGITWPVIYTGGRENSPSITYGVSSIPTLILLDSDGIILARGHSVEELGVL